MDNKRITIILSILLIVIIILLLLKSCGVLPHPMSHDQEQPVYQQEVLMTEVDADSGTVVAVVVEEKKEEPKPKVTAPKKATSKIELPKPAVQKPKAVTKAPSYTNKSGFKPFYIYTEVGSKDNHYSPYGLMGDIRSISIDQGCQTNPHSGKSCIKVTYAPTAGIGWAGLYWTEPANNWGDKGYGFNLTGAERISFWARGEEGGEIINNFIMGGIQGKASEDSDSRAIGPVELSQEWQQYIIYIEDADLTNIIGGFCATITKMNNPNGAVIYLDDIVYE